MNKAKIAAFVTDKVAATKKFVKANSPEILVGLGIVGGVVSAVMACKETRKVDELNYEFVNEKEGIKEKYGLQYEGITPDVDTAHAYKKDLTKATFKHIGRVVLAYAPSAALGAASASSILAGFGKMKAMYTTSAAAASALLKDYNNLCNRIEARYGEEVRYELVNGIEKETVKEKIVDENGKKKTVTKTVDKLPNDMDLDTFSRLWGKGCGGYDEKDMEHNRFFVMQQLKSINRLLKDRWRPAKDGVPEIPGVVSFNEALLHFGFDPESLPDYGEFWGWVYSEENPVGDNVINIGLVDSEDPQTIRFVNGKEGSVLMNFNCDSVITPYLKRRPYFKSKEEIAAEDVEENIHYHQFELDDGLGWNCNEY